MEIERVIVVGATGTGKTTWVRNHIREIQSQEPGRFFFIADPQEYYSCRERFYTARGEGGFLEYFEKDSVQPGTYCFTLTKILDWDSFFQLVGDFSGASDVPPRPFNNTTLVVDELLDHSDAHSTQEKLEHFFRYGRHAGLSLICCSMRPKNVDGMLLNNANRFICFRQGRIIDVDALRGVTLIGDDALDLLELDGHDFLEFPRKEATEVESQVDLRGVEKKALEKERRLQNEKEVDGKNPPAIVSGDTDNDSESGTVGG